MSFYNNENGVSPIIATLMLILITIIAASGLAVISAQLQEDHIDRTELIAAVEGEKLRIVDIDLFNNTSSTEMPHRLDRINITVHNMDIKPASIFIRINNNNSGNFTANVPGLFNDTDRLPILGGGYRTLVVNISNLSLDPITIFNNEPIHVEIITSRVNKFSRVFTPPVIIPMIDIRSEPARLNTFRDILILDASRSFDPDKDGPDKDGFIVSHNWSVNYTNIDTGEMHTIFLHGQQVRPTFVDSNTNLPINATNVSISLTLTDNTGMISRQESFTTLRGNFYHTA